MNRIHVTMASIFPRHNKDGSVTWRVMIRRKGLKTFITGFADESDAWKFVNECEEKYCLDPENFTYDHLKSKREREFARS
jgi:hypothetical protein